jgi:hypothetical protein
MMARNFSGFSKLVVKPDNGGEAIIANRIRDIQKVDWHGIRLCGE